MFPTPAGVPWTMVSLSLSLSQAKASAISISMLREQMCGQWVQPGLRPHIDRRIKTVFRRVIRGLHPGSMES